MQLPDNQIVPKKRKWTKILKRLAITLAIIIGTGGAMGVFLGYYFENTVKRIIISELNKRLNTQIVLNNVEEDIEFSIFSKFPYATVHFINPIMKDAVEDTNGRGNLLEAKDIYLQMSLLDLIMGKYRLKRIEIADARLTIKIFKDGSDNYHFWKPSSDTTSDDFTFDLQKLILRNTAILLTDLDHDQDYQALAKNLIIKGKFASTDFTLNIDGDLYISHIISHNINYFSNKSTQLDMTLYVNSETGSYVFKEGELYVGRMPFTITGEIIDHESTLKLNLKIEGKNLDLETVIRDLPQQYRKHFANYNCGGNFYFTVELNGFIHGNNQPVISASFGLKNGELEQKESSVKLENISFGGTYSNGNKQSLSSSVLEIRDFTSKLREGYLTGNLKIANFNKPEVTLDAKAGLDFAWVQEFLKIDSIESASGKLSLDVHFKGVLSGNSFSMADFISSQSEGNMKIENGEVAFKGSKHHFSNLNGSFDFTNNDLISKDLTGNFSLSDFRFSGNFRNLLPYLFLENERLQVNASLISKNIDMDDLLQYRVSSTDTTYRLAFNPKIDFRLDLDIGKFSFRKFAATGISGQVSVVDNQFVAKNISLSSMDGKVSLTGLIDASQQGKLLISCDAVVTKVNIRKLFYQFENFGQKSFCDNNVNGTLTSNIQFASVWTNTFEVDEKTIFARANISINNGELTNYEPLAGLSSFLKGRDLTHVRFATLTNTIEIKDRIINIPEMSIKSSALDFEVNGTHSFDNQIDYHLSVLIADLNDPNKPIKDDYTDYGVVEDDGLHQEKYFFRITGTVDDPKYQKLDKEAYKENIAGKVKEEKENLKTILNREFGWFKKDSAVIKNGQQDNKNNPPKEKFDFNIQWDEDEEEEIPVE